MISWIDDRRRKYDEFLKDIFCCPNRKRVFYLSELKENFTYTKLRYYYTPKLKLNRLLLE